MVTEKTMDELITDYIQLQESVGMLTETLDRTRMELHQRMESQGATAWPHPTHKVELKSSLSYDHAKLIPLRELIDPVELESSGAFIPEHEDTNIVPDMWNMTKVKPFAKYGDNIKAIIKGAAYVSKTSLSIKPKPEPKTKQS